MTKAKAILKAVNYRRMSIELGDEEQVVIGTVKDAEVTTSERPDYDLGTILPSDRLEDVARRHAILTYKEGDFWLKSLDEHKTWLGPHVLTPGFFFRMFDGDAIRFGRAELTFCIQSVVKAE
jgi:hypothetical protein